MRLRKSSPSGLKKTLFKGAMVHARDTTPKRFFYCPDTRSKDTFAIFAGFLVKAFFFLLQVLASQSRK